MYLIRQAQRQISQLESKLRKEKRFNRTAEIRKLCDGLSRIDAGDAC